VFIHLHLHSEYSLVDSTVRLPELIKATAAAGMPAVALTDESALFGLVRFFKAAESAGIKPLAGADVWVDYEGEAHRLTLLCQHNEGYRNLCRLLSSGYEQRTAGSQPRVQLAQVADCATGLIALSGRQGPMAAAFAAHRESVALARAAQLQQLFPDRLYLELNRLGFAGEEQLNQAALWLACERDLPIIASNDVRFLAREDFEAHEARVAIHDGQVLADPRRQRKYRPEQYLKTPAEMAQTFADLPMALANTVELSKRLNLELKLGKYFLPDYPTPKHQSIGEYLAELSHEGLQQRIAVLTANGVMVTSEEGYRERLDIEIGVINKMGFPGYFLIVADFIRWGKANGVPVGPGRGSGAGSLVAYALGITDLDPLRYELLFERFLNPERVSMPDFDVDFCMDTRDKVIDYVADKYGRNQVSQIITFGTMAAKACIRDAGRVLGFPFPVVDGLAKLIPNTLGIELADAANDPELRDRLAADEEARSIFDLALKLEGLTRNAGKHAGGVVIAPTALTDFVPLYFEDAGEGAVTQFDKDDVEAAGLVKFDFLGLRTLTILKWALQAIERRHGVVVDLNALPLDDAKTYALLKRCHTTAVFQLESRGMKELIRKLQPDTFEDIIALCALFRPGPLQSGMVDDFVERKHGRQEISYPHPALETVLKPTYGVIVYQEQVMQIAQVLAGYSLGGADLLRRAMGKKKPEEMAQQRAIFEAGAGKNGVDATVATDIFDLMEKFAEYGFNKSHSAAYALIAFQTAWLKAHYCAEFMAATLSSDMDNTDKVVEFADDLKVLGVKLLPPDVNASEWMFAATGDREIRYGLGAIKGMGQGACEAVVEQRQRGGPFRDLFDFTQRLDLAKFNRRTLEVLVHSGALDSLGANRATLMFHLPQAVKLSEQQARDRASGQVDLFGGTPTADPPKYQPQGEFALLARLKAERDTLGRYLSGHPLDHYRTPLTSLGILTLAEIPARVPKKVRRGQEPQMLVAGQITAVRRRGENQAFVRIDDGHGALELAFFSEAFNEYSRLLTTDTLLLAEGGASFDEFSGGYQLRVKQAFALEEGLARHLVLIRLHAAASADVQLAQELRRLLEPVRGGATRVHVQLQRTAGRAELALGEDWQVHGSAVLSEALGKLPAVTSVELVYKRRAS
jgi:DNA polymerase-3 subunit alpha